MMGLIETFSWIVTMLFIVIIFGLLVYVSIIVLMVIGKLLWTIFKEPLSEMYFDYLDWKQSRLHKRKRLKWYVDYSKFI